MHLFAPAPSEVLKARYGDRYRWLLLMALMVGVIASIIPATSVNVAIPAMSAYFQVGQERAQWITSSFMMASTIGMLVTPWMLALWLPRHLCLLHRAADTGWHRGRPVAAL